MKQRLCLGRALIHDPAVLILDEPAAGLDPRARIELRQIIRSLAADGKTILVSSHILTELAEICDRVGIIEQGRLLATGSVEEMRLAKRTTRQMIIHIRGDLGPAMEMLRPIDEVSDLRSEDSHVYFELTGANEQQIDILRGLIHGGIDVISYASRNETLEDVFLHITEGRIQ